MGYGKLQNDYGKSSIEKYFKDCDDIDFLDAIDYFFYLIDKKIRTIKPKYQYDYDADGAINAAIAELNYRFKQHNLGYEFANSQIITIDKIRDVRSDIYSVGAIWYFLLCGRAPSGSDMREYLEKSNSQITPTDIDIIMKCLSSSIKNRYSSCEELLPIVKNAAMG